MQLPKTLLPMPQTGPQNGAQPEANGAESAAIPPGVPADVVDRMVLLRKLRKVKFYLRNNRYKRCLCDLSPEQIRAMLLIIQKTGRTKAETFVFQDDSYLVSPQTKRVVK